MEFNKKCLIKSCHKTLYNEQKYLFHKQRHENTGKMKFFLCDKWVVNLKSHYNLKKHENMLNNTYVKEKFTSS